MGISLNSEYVVIKTFFHPDDAWSWVHKELTCGTALDGDVRYVNFVWQASVIYQDGEGNEEED